jgi:putative hydrolase of the HAD superfamily
VSFSAVLFDLDGTLCEPVQSAESVYAGAFDAAGIDRFGEPDELWAALERPPDHDDPIGYFAAGFATVAARNGRTPVDATALARGFLETVDYSRVRPREGAEAAVEAAARRGRVGLVTNGPESRQAAKLEALPFGDAFEAVVYAGDLSRRKPNRDPFERGVESLSTQPEEAVYIGDSLEYDVVGAQNAGLAAAWCPSDDPDADPAPYTPEYVLDSPAEIERILRENK